MKKFYSLAVAVLACWSVIFAQTEYKVRLQSDNTTYVVSMKPSTTWTGNNATTISAQVTLVVPAGGFVASNPSNIAGQWIYGGTVSSPPENVGFDYIFYNLNALANDIGYTAGSEVDLFSFTNGGTCTGALDLIDHSSDPMYPTNSGKVNAGNTLITVGGGPGTNTYVSNFDAGSANCALVQGCVVEYRIDLLGDGITYQISLLPNVTWTGTDALTSTAQVSILVPTNQFTVSALTSAIPGVSFTHNSTYPNPPEQPGFDFLSFGLASFNTSLIPYQSGVPVPLFTFQNGSNCSGQIRLVQDSDAFVLSNNQGANVANQLTTFGSGIDADICTDVSTFACGINNPDTDNDGVPNSIDACPNTPAGAVVNNQGCSDADGDGYYPGAVINGSSYDPNDANPCIPSSNGPNCDSDGDGVINNIDQCPNSQFNAQVNSLGCTDNDGDGYYPDALFNSGSYDPNDANPCIPVSNSQSCDSDGDGVVNSVDQCPNSLPNAQVNSLGCTDNDGDGYYPDAPISNGNYDPNDSNPCIPASNSLSCDADGDGVINGVDQCPNSQPNAQVNSQGCTDSDNDGYYPDALFSSGSYDPNDTNPCVPVSTGLSCDADGDGVVNGVDQCPNSQPNAQVNSQGCTDGDSDGYYPDAPFNSGSFDPNDNNPCMPANTSLSCDADGDGVINSVDQCPNSQPNAQVNSQGCTDIDGDGYYPDAPSNTPGYDPNDFNVCIPNANHILCFQDSDGDGVHDNVDLCPFTPQGMVVNSSGCSDQDRDGYFPGLSPGDPQYDPKDNNPCEPDNTVASCDDDVDGVPNGYDDCPFSAGGATVDGQGCTDDDNDGYFPDINSLFTNYDPDDGNPCIPDNTSASCDADGDGIPNATDQCPNSVPGAVVNLNGCTDLDGDGYFPDLPTSHPLYDPRDNSPCEPDNTVATCDDDSDGVPNGFDDCPFSAAGANVDGNGCTDNDGDGYFPDIDPQFSNFDPNDNILCIPDNSFAACDSDGDGVPNGVDQCPNSLPGAVVTLNGCTDLDGDGYFPDLPISDPQYDPRDNNPCEPDNTVATCDDDSDGVPNGYDDCPFSAPGANVDGNGCTDNDGDGYFPDIDSQFSNFDPNDNIFCVPDNSFAACDIDGDGVNNGDDQCPNSAFGVNVDGNGCMDGDGDGYFPDALAGHPQFDPNDSDPCVPNSASIACDSDGDGIPNADDSCPNSQLGANVNSLGCTDADGDGYFPDAPSGSNSFDPNDNQPCTPDNTVAVCDTDGDGVPDIQDQCPNTPFDARLSVSSEGCSDIDEDGYFPGALASSPLYDPNDLHPCIPDNTVVNCDDDADGVPNGFDDCPFSAAGAVVDGMGCTDDDKDGYFPDIDPSFPNFDPNDSEGCIPDNTGPLCDVDDDGINNENDACPNTIAGASVNDFGCTDTDGDQYYPDAESGDPRFDPDDGQACIPDPSAALCDSDNDGVVDALDFCPNTPVNSTHLVDVNGCSDIDEDGYFPGANTNDPNFDPNDFHPCIPDNTVANCDDDEDGVPNGFDDCPFSSFGANVDGQGCTDTDGDGFFPDIDPSFPNFDPDDRNKCIPDGLGPDCDTDGDGVPNSTDNCPNTLAGATVNAAGCTDIDGDGYYPDIDPNDTNFDPDDVVPCIPDENAPTCDSDNDGVANASDMCPNTPVNAAPHVDSNGCSDIDEDGYFPGLGTDDSQFDPNDLHPCIPDNTVANCDDDEDGLPNGLDICPFSAPGALVDENGCTDNDGDGYFPDIDPSFPNYDPLDDNACIPDNSGPDCGDGLIEVEIAAKVFLQGAYNCTTGLMSDDLRARGFIPTLEPYSTWEPAPDVFPFVHNSSGGGENSNLSVLEVTGREAIVDWVFLELRNKFDPKLIQYTKSALLQRDGDIVDVDGVSPVFLRVKDDDYYFVVRHRNHLSVMTAEAVPVVDNNISYDFTDPNSPTFGTDAQRLMSTFTTCDGGFDNVMAMWGGDADADGKVILEGGGEGIPDKTRIFFDVMTHPDNDTGGFNFSAPGYFGGDTNLDGEARLQGLDNDIDKMIFFNVIINPANTEFLMNFVIVEQLPR